MNNELHNTSLPMKAKLQPHSFHKNLVKSSLGRPNDVPSDFFYRFMKELPYKLLPQTTSSKPRFVIENTPEFHRRVSTPFDKLRDASPLDKKRMLQAARSASKDSFVSYQDTSSTRAQKNIAIIKNVSDLHSKEKENTSDLLKKCHQFFKRRLVESKVHIKKQFKKDRPFSSMQKRKAVEDYY